MVIKTPIPVEERKFRIINENHEPVLDHDISLTHAIFNLVTMVANYYDGTHEPTLPEDLVIGEKAIIRVQVGQIDATYVLLRTK